MHELGIIIHISKTLKEVAEENEVTKIGSVTLEIGEVSGIDVYKRQVCRQCDAISTGNTIYGYFCNHTGYGRREERRCL